jgi:alkylhydroperoxidase family enzyme
MTGTGSLAKDDRELAALATSLATGPEHCVGARPSPGAVSKDQVTAVALATTAPDAVIDPCRRAIIDVAGRLTHTPSAVELSDIERPPRSGSVPTTCATSWPSRRCSPGPTG